MSMRRDASMNQSLDYKSEDTKTDHRSNISVKDYLIMIQNTEKTLLSLAYVIMQYFNFPAMKSSTRLDQIC